MTKEQLIEAMVTDVMESFDFNKVHDTMVRYNWEWAIGDTMQVPSMYIIMKKAEYLLRTSAKYYGEKDFYYTSSGGFTANLENSCLSLQFVLAEYRSYYGDFIKDNNKE